MLSVVELSPDKQSCNLSQLYHHEMVYSTVLYIYCSCYKCHLTIM